MPIPNYKKGDLITDRYKVVKRLGKGGMGTVYLALDTTVGTEIAIKLIDSNVRVKKDLAARVHQEIRSAYNLNNEYVTALYSILLEDDYVGLILEYVEGECLYNVISKQQTLSIQDIIVISRQIALGLRAIHAAGIIHRDIKPENIILSKKGIAKITDFGVSILTSTLNLEKPEIADGDDLLKARVTASGAVMGTLPYIPPEYLANHQLDIRADIYALGLVMYELVTLQFPYEFKTNFQLIEDKVLRDPPPPSHFRSDCPEWLDKLILTAMRRDPELRFRTADEIYKLLAPRTLGLTSIPATNKLTADLRNNLATVRKSGKYTRASGAISNPTKPIEESVVLRTFLLIGLLFASLAAFYQYIPQDEILDIEFESPVVKAYKVEAKDPELEDLNEVPLFTSRPATSKSSEPAVTTSGGHRVFSGKKAPTDTIIIRSNKRVN